MNDLRWGFRSLRQTPAVATVIVATLALGIGANAAIFSLLDAVLLRGFPYANASRLALVWMTNPQGGLQQDALSSPDLRDLAARNHSFQALLHYGFGYVNLTGARQPEALLCAWVAPELLRVLGARTVAGRLFLDDETQADRENAVVLSHALWRSRFGGDPAVIGTSITLNQRAYAVVGVAAPEFSGPPGFDLDGSVANQKAEPWMPFNLARRSLATIDLTGRATRWAQVIALLRPGVSVEAAGRDAQEIASTLAAEHPESNKGWGMRVRSLEEQTTAGVRTAVWLLMAAAGGVLLLACANVAIILLARASARTAEMAIRSALGAGSGALIRQLLAEGLAYAVVGGVASIGVAYAGVRVLKAMAPGNAPRMAEASVNPAVLLFTLALVVGTAILFGLVPALRASRTNPADALRASGRSPTSVGRRWLEAFVALEFALTCALLAGSGLLLRSYVELNRVRPGFDANNLVTGDYYLPYFSYGKPEQRVVFQKKLMDGLQGMAAVESVGLIDWLPFGGYESRQGFEVEGQPPASGAERPSANLRTVSPGYFATLRIPLRAGRLFTDRDQTEAKLVAIINETLARRRFGNQDPIGRRLNLAEPPAPAVWREVVGVVGNVKHIRLHESDFPDIYVPAYQQSPDLFTVVVRTPFESKTFGPMLRRATAGVDPDQPVNEIHSMDSLIAASMASERLRTALLAAFALGALLLALAGAGGVTWFAVISQTREMGLRMALGATPAETARLVLRRALAVASVGVAAGLCASFAAARAIGSLLYAVSPFDPATFAIAPLTLLAAAVAASAIPAWRAMRVEPMEALRSE